MVSYNRTTFSVAPSVKSCLHRRENIKHCRYRQRWRFEKIHIACVNEPLWKTVSKTCLFFYGQTFYNPSEYLVGRRCFRKDKKMPFRSNIMMRKKYFFRFGNVFSSLLRSQANVIKHFAAVIYENLSQNWSVCSWQAFPVACIIKTIMIVIMTIVSDATIWSIAYNCNWRH